MKHNKVTGRLDYQIHRRENFLLLHNCDGVKYFWAAGAPERTRKKVQGHGHDLGVLWNAERCASSGLVREFWNSAVV